MSEFSKLVDVKFEDRTSYVASPNAEILALPFIHPWGPEMSNETLSYTEFMQIYQESLPLFASLAHKKAAQDALRTAFKNWVQIKRAFSTGMGGVLAQRCTTGKYVYVAYANSSAANPTVSVDTLAAFTVATSPILRLKYSGFPTSADLGVDASIFGKMHVKITKLLDGNVTVKLQVVESETDIVFAVEEFDGSVNPDEVVDGQTFYINDVVNNGSAFIADFKIENVKSINPDVAMLEDSEQAYEYNEYDEDHETLPYKWTGEDNSTYRTAVRNPAVGATIYDNEGTASSTVTAVELYPDTVDVELDPENGVATEEAVRTAWESLVTTGVPYSKAYDLLSDPDVTQYTILLSPVEPASSSAATGAGLVPSDLYLIPADRKDVNLLVGFNTTNAFTKTAIQTAFEANMAAAQEPKMMTFFLAAREYYNAFGITYILDGCAAWAGRMANVASSVRLNQMPSARQYGPVAATLKDSLTFNQVLELHEKGCNSIYNSAYGPCIFGIKSLHKRQMSYFGKANVARVTARLIKYIYPEVMNVIHTDTVNDPINRAKFQLAMSNILDEFIANGNIRSESTVDVSDAVNNDVTTKGGEVLNVQFTIWFKKLVEKVNILVVATDSSVNVSIS